MILEGHLNINTLVLALIGVMTLLNTYYSRKTEKNTNGMKDALVARTRDSAHAAGREEMRTEGEAKAAVLAKGVMQGKAETKEEVK